MNIDISGGKTDNTHISGQFVSVIGSIQVDNEFNPKVIATDSVTSQFNTTCISYGNSIKHLLNFRPLK